MKNFRYSKKPSDSFKSMLRKSGFLHMVNNSKVAGKYWRGCTSFNSLHKYEDLEQVYLSISRELILEMMVLDEFVDLHEI